MTREEHLRFCEKCLNRTFDSNKGIVCKLTGDIAKFENECPDFVRDEKVPDAPILTVEEQQARHVELDDTLRRKAAAHQNLAYAVIGGLLLSIICALLWAVITVSIQYQIGYMAIGVGFVVGMGVRFFGAGVDQIYGILGALFALLGCMLGNLFSQIGFIAHQEGFGYLQTLSLLDLDTILLIYQESFSPMDVLFYGFAIYEGYRFAFRPITEADLSTADLAPSNSHLRLPIVLGSFSVLLASGIFMSFGYSGPQTYYYESGEVMSVGKVEGGKETGPWEYYYENGNIRLRGEYLDGKETGIWRWFSEDGITVKEGGYKNGLADGVWMTYFESGAKQDSTFYIEGRMTGMAVAYHENGQLRSKGGFLRDKADGPWSVFYDNGQMQSTGEYRLSELFGPWKYWNMDGSPSLEITYKDKEESLVMNAWDLGGTQTVIDGNGVYTNYDDFGTIIQSGNVENGEKIGVWKMFYSNGDVKEEGQYNGPDYSILNTWSPDGSTAVVNGNGEYTTYYSENKIFETGSVRDGKREGLWETFYETSDQVMLQSQFKGGKLNGTSTYYFESGNVSAEGNLVEGLRQGEWIWYFESGGVECSVSYENDKKQGVQTFYSENGEPAKEEIYEDGELSSEKLL